MIFLNRSVFFFTLITREIMCINGAYTIFRNETKRKARYCVTSSMADSIRQCTRLSNLDKHGQLDDILYNRRHFTES